MNAPYPPLNRMIEYIRSGLKPEEIYDCERVLSKKKVRK